MPARAGGRSQILNLLFLKGLREIVALRPRLRKGCIIGVKLPDFG